MVASLKRPGNSGPKGGWSVEATMRPTLVSCVYESLVQWYPRVLSTILFFVSTGCRSYTIGPGSGEGGDTPECDRVCDEGYTIDYEDDKHFGKKGRRKKYFHK